MAPVEIKAALAADQPFLLEMMAHTMQSLPRFAGRDLAELERLARLELIDWREGRDFAFIAWRAGERAGALWLHGAGEARALQFTLGLAVAPAFRRAGTGAALLAHAADFARQNGGRELVLKVHPTNEAARRLYHRAGFEITLLEMKSPLR